MLYWTMAFLKKSIRKIIKKKLGMTNLYISIQMSIFPKPR